MAVVFRTDGNGDWSIIKRRVHIVNITLGRVAHEGDFGELRVSFALKSWDPDKDGLIYSDEKFLQELKAFLSDHGLVVKDVYYRKQGCKATTM